MANNKIQKTVVAVKKDDALVSTQVAITSSASVMSFSEGGGLIQTTSG